MEENPYKSPEFGGPERRRPRRRSSAGLAVLGLLLGVISALIFLDLNMSTAPLSLVAGSVCSVSGFALACWITIRALRAGSKGE